MDELKVKPSSIEAEGKSVDDAIEKGLEQLNATKDEVEIKVLHEGKSGLFGLMGKPYKVMLTLKGQGARKHEKRIQSKDLNETEKIALEEAERLMKLMNFDSVKVSVAREPFDDEPDSREIKINIDSKNDRDISLLIGKNGKTMASLEIVLQTIINNRIAKLSSSSDKKLPKIIVDVNNYYERKIEKAMQDVQNAVSQVNRAGKNYRLEPMPPRIRKYIHNKLKDSPDVITLSEGEGSERCVVIRPKND